MKSVELINSCVNNNVDYLYGRNCVIESFLQIDQLV